MPYPPVGAVIVIIPSFAPLQVTFVDATDAARTGRLSNYKSIVKNNITSCICRIAYLDIIGSW